MSTFVSRVAAWGHRNMPKREELEHNRWIGPFARRPELWRFTRRSVPRGVAVGLLVGIFALIPGIQIIGAALMCVPSRGNIPLAALMTFLSNPATTPFIIAASIYLGNKLGFHADVSTFEALMARGASMREWAYWLLSDAAPAMLLGLFVISVITAAVGYLVSSFTWNWWVRRKRRHAQDRLREARGEG
jgi:uncharacterized protein (DUF2062 family)